LPPSGEGALYDDLISILYLRSTDDFQGSDTILQQKLKGWFALLVGNRLYVAHLTHHDHFFAVIELRMSHQVCHLQELGIAGRREQQRVRDENQPKKDATQGSAGYSN
jgi:hypothetical protein